MNKGVEGAPGQSFPMHRLSLIDVHVLRLMVKRSQKPGVLYGRT